VTGDADALAHAVGPAMARARGPWLCHDQRVRPSDGWLDAISDAHRADYSGIGVHEVASDATLVDRAIHLVRYTSYLPPLAPAVVPEIAATMARIKREALRDVMAAIERGRVLETEITASSKDAVTAVARPPHSRHLLRIAFDPRLFPARYLHGRTFGRPGRCPARARLLDRPSARAPLVPALMLARASARFTPREGWTFRDCWAAPLAGWFFVCWAPGRSGRTPVVTVVASANSGAFVSLVIPSRTEALPVLDCVESFMPAADADFEVIVSECGSLDTASQNPGPVPERAGPACRRSKGPSPSCGGGYSRPAATSSR